MDMEFKDETLFQGYWMMETSQGLNLGDQDHDPQWYLPLFVSNYPSFESSQAINQDEMENFIDDVPTEWWVGLGTSDLECQEVGSQESISSPAKVSSPYESCINDSHWTRAIMMEADNEDEYVRLSRGFPKEELKVTSYWEKNELDLDHDQDFDDFGLNQQNFGMYHGFDRSNESCAKGVRSLGIRKPGEKRHTKPEKVISLQVLRQYFAQSLKEAARFLGVCPTTLKRICRQHGINRWPSRKIKKVNHSLRKLQRVVDSVEGAEGLIQISPIYSTFPELSTPNNLPNNNHLGSSLKLRDTSKDIKPHQENPTNGYQCGVILKVKASFGESNIRFSLLPQWNFKELQAEMAKRFGIDCFNGIHVKYLDNDHESVLLTCDEDLQECKDLFRYSQNQTVKMFLHQSPLPSPKK